MNRRTLLRRSLAGAVGLTASQAAPRDTASAGSVERTSFPLNGEWLFRVDPKNQGENEGWHSSQPERSGWSIITVPHTWQVVPEFAEYYGAAWYRRHIEIPRVWSAGVVQIEFEAVFHSASVWVNGKLAGTHNGKGYTAFTFDVTDHARFGESNTIAVRVDSAFNDNMLPRGKSSDWTHDGGIYRPVTLRVVPKTFIQRLQVDALPDVARAEASVDITMVLQNRLKSAWHGAAGYHVIDEQTGSVVLRNVTQAELQVDEGSEKTVRFSIGRISNPRLWHFDRPNLYRLVAQIRGDEIETTFGIRRFEVKPDGFYLNSERVQLMGVERMAGSHPEYGMAEPAHWIEHDHDDLKQLNCVFTRVHWQQDQRVLDYCDRHGILIQVEVPTWGPDTFKGMGDQPSPEIMQNGLEQLREMIQRDRNHPCIFAWGLCNEIGGQAPAAYNFAKRMYEEARALDPARLRSYASNSLSTTPERDVAGLMDFIEWNEYYESWYKGGLPELRQNLEAIHKAFPTKPLVISEYGFCACTADRPENDPRRIEILRTHTQAFRDSGVVAGAIFFCYNDYRTHIGDHGSGVTKQRVHGVVDLFGNRKPSFEALRQESSPIEEVRIAKTNEGWTATIKTRKALPAYPLKDYKLRAIVFGEGNIPLEVFMTTLNDIGPGESAVQPIPSKQANPTRIQVDVLRPTETSAATASL